MQPLIHTILVPQGSEYQAVCRGLRHVPAFIRPTVVPIPIGITAFTRQLQTWKHAPFFEGQRVLIMGLCGGMTPQHSVGEAVLYEACVCGFNDPPVVLMCDRTLTLLLQEKLSIPLVKGLTSARLLCSAQEKSDLSQRYGTDVVDMESFAALQILSHRGVAVAVLRVVSDGSQHDIPDLTPAIDLEGAIRPLPLALGLLRQPIAASHLIRGALQGLKTLQALPPTLFGDVNLKSSV